MKIKNTNSNNNMIQVYFENVIAISILHVFSKGGERYSNLNSEFASLFAPKR